MAKRKRSKKSQPPRKSKPAQIHEQNTKSIMVFGDQKAQEEFNQEYGEFIKRLPRLYGTIQSTLALVHGRQMSRPDAIVMALTRMAFEDFRQIMILCSNGETPGGMKILRGMCERVVTAKYLHMRPEEADAFINFFPISRYKEANEARFFNISEEVIAEIKAERDAVKARYLVDDCKKCGTTRVNHTWTKMSLVDMAKEVNLRIPLLEGYYFSMQETHATMASIERRMRLDEETQRFTYDDTEHPTDRTSTLRTSHYLGLSAIEILRDRFELADALNKQYGQCIVDFTEIWRLPTTEASHVAAEQ